MKTSQEVLNFENDAILDFTVTVPSAKKGATTMKKVTYLEQRFYDNGTVRAKLHAQKPTCLSGSKYDSYVDTIGKGQGFETLEAWIEELLIELDDIIPLVLDLEAGKWVDISAYC